MNNQLEKYILKQKFKSIIECINFLYLIGFSIEESYNISSELFNLKININTKFLLDEKLFFVECLNGCEIIIDKNYLNSIFYIKNGEVWFEQDLKNEWFWCSYKNVWSVFEIKYQWNYQQIQVFIKNMLEKHLRLSGIIPNIQSFQKKLGWKSILRNNN